MAEEQSPALEGALASLGRRMREHVVPIIRRLPSYGRLVYGLVTDPHITAGQRTALLVAVGYQISPVDLIPGFIPVIGQLDDLLVMLWAIRRTLDALPTERREAILAAANLTNAQVEADMGIVRSALHEVFAGSARAAGRGVRTAVKGIVAGAVFLGCFAYFAVKSRQRGGK
jgi:uncharacterized membrane protein YkvA (DUF1232 family)